MSKKNKEILDKEFIAFRDGMRERNYSEEVTPSLTGPASTGRRTV